MTKDGNTDLHWSCRHGQNLKVVELLKSGLAVNAMAMDGNTPLHWACREGYSDIVDVLLAHEADVNLVAKDGYTPLHWACRGGFTSIVCVLLKCKPDVNALTGENYTALHWACRGGNCDTITALMKSNPDVNTVAFDGNTPLHLAVSRNDQKMVELLLSQISGSEGHPHLAKQLSIKWRQVGIFLGIKNMHLDNIRADFPNDTEEQSFQMLNSWFQSSIPEKRTVDILKEALEEAECFGALDYLPSKKSQH